MLLVGNCLVTILAGLASPLLTPYLMLSDKRRCTLLARFGIKNGIRAPVDRSARRPIWVHALSVGETLAAVPLLKALRHRYPGRPLYFSVSTRSGLETARRALSGLVDAVFVSTLDVPLAIRRLTWKVNPAAVIMVESDVWPNFVQVMRNKKIPLFWVNARLSERSYRRFRRIAPLARLFFGRFDGICVQSAEDHERLLGLGVPAELVTHTGNLKFDQAAPALTGDDRAALPKRLGLHPADRLLLAGSTHDGEEALVLQTWRRLRPDCPNLRLVVAPRDPNRARAIVDLCRAHGFTPERWSGTSATQAQHADVMIIDCLGLLKNLYAVADIALVGGSLLDYEKVGGHNPLEPAAFATPTLVGPNMKNFPEITRLLKEGEALVQLADSDHLHAAVSALLGDPAAAREMGERARAALVAHRGAAAKMVQSVDAKWDRLQQAALHSDPRRWRRKGAAGLSESTSLPLQP